MPNPQINSPGNAQQARPWTSVPVPGSAADAAANNQAPWLSDSVVSQGSGNIPPLPPGYTLEHPQAAIPPPPPGYVLEQPQGAIPPPPPGYVIDSHPTAAEPWRSDPVVTPMGSAPWLNDPIAPKDTSYGSALQEGLHDAAHGLGRSAALLAKDVGWTGGENIGNAVAGSIPAPANYQSAGGDMVAKIKAGQLLAALKDLPRAAVEGAPSVAGGLTAAGVGALAAPEVLGGAAVGSALGAAGYGAASAFGDNADARAAANGHAAPTPGDQLAAGATALAQGGLNAVGLAKVPGASALLRASPAYARALTAGGLDAAGQAASNVVGQVGTSAGTQQGLTVDPDQAAAAGLTGLAARGAGKGVGQVAGAVGSGAGSAVRSIGMSLAATPLLKDMTPDQAASFTRLNNAYDAQDPARAEADPTTRMNGLWKQTQAQLGQVVDAARATGQLDADTTASLKTAIQQAAVHKSALDRNLLDKLNAETVSPQLADTLRNGLTDLDNLSQMVNYKQATGPFAALGAKLAAPAAVIGGASMMLHGLPVEGMATMAAPFVGVGHGNLAGRYGAAVGGMLDKVAGTSLPPSLVLRAQAMKAAQAAGYDTSGNTVASLDDTYAGLQALADQQQAAQAAQAQAAADALTKAKAADLVERSANQVSGMAYKTSPEGILAKANAAIRRKDILTQAAAEGRLRQPMSQDQMDRVSIGLPPSDPIPVNTPLDANGQPLQQPQGVRLSPPVGAPAQPQQVGLQGTPATPQGGPQGGYNPSGWLDHLSTHLVSNGLVPSPEVIGKALGGLVASGQWTQDYADRLLSDPKQFLKDRSVPFQQAIAQAQINAGMTPSPIVPEVKSPVKYAAGVQSRQTLGNTLMQAADSQGDIALKVALARILAAPEVSVQQGIAQRIFSERQNDQAALERAQRLLPPELFKGRRG